MILQCSSKDLENHIFICKSKSDVKKVIREFKGKYKYCEREEWSLLNGSVVYGVYVGNSGVEKYWFEDFIDLNDHLILDEFSESE